MNKQERLDDLELSDLFESAGPRPEPTPEATARVVEATRAEWKKHWRRERSGLRDPRRLALVAALVVMLAGVLAVARWGNPLAGPAALGHVVALTGSTNVVIGDELAEDALISTDEGMVALRLATGHGLRLDRASRLRFGRAGNVTLEAGAVYVDHSPTQGDGLLVVRSEFGDVHEIGTQFEVRVGTPSRSLQVRVREGRVEVETGEGRLAARAGEEVAIDGDGQVVRTPIDRWGPAWSWTQQAAPDFALDGVTLGSYLDWLQRETGWEIGFENADLERQSLGIVLRGSVAGLRPDATPSVVLPGCGLAYDRDEGVLRILSASGR